LRWRGNTPPLHLIPLEEFMKKLILALMIVGLLCSSVYAETRNENRQVSSGLDSTTGTDVIKSSPGQLFGANILATSNGGWIAVYDSSNTTLSGKTVLLEIGEATSGNSKIETLPGITCFNGITVESSNAKFIIYYY